MTKGLGYAPTGKSKNIPTPDVNSGGNVGSMGNIHIEPVEVVNIKKDTNPVKGTRAARKQKPVTWY